MCCSFIMFLVLCISYSSLDMQTSEPTRAFARLVNFSLYKFIFKGLKMWIFSFLDISVSLHVYIYFPKFVFVSKDCFQICFKYLGCWFFWLSESM